MLFRSTTAPSTTSQPPYIFAAKGPCQSYAQANPTAQVATTADYVIVANMGPSESMYTPAQAASSHPMSGEIMVSGTMDSGMPMGSGTVDHIEAHICSKSTGNVMTDIMPTMHLQATETAEGRRRSRSRKCKGWTGIPPIPTTGTTSSSPLGGAITLR